MSKINKNKQNCLTIERLKELVEITTDGEFFNLKTRGGLKVGKKIGCLGKDGYISIEIDNTPFKAHRLAWFYHYGAWPDGDIDHINGRKTDNRIENLRDIPHRINLQNRFKRNRVDSSLPTGINIGHRFGDGTPRDYVAYWNDNEGKHCTKYFSVKKLGSRDAAFIAACSYRLTMINHRNKEGANYTERHGKGNQHSFVKDEK